MQDVYELLYLLPKSLIIKTFCSPGKFLSKFGLVIEMDSNGHDKL
jgi:hypothetical protein